LKEGRRMITKRTVIATFFATLCIVAAAFLAASTYNYVEFYRAVEKFDAKLQNVRVVVDENNVKANITFEMQNPTNYVGMSLREWSYALVLEIGNEEIDLSHDSISYYSEPVAISPHWTQTFERGTDLYATQNSTLRFLELYPFFQGKQVNWTLQVQVILITFMGTMPIPMSSALSSEL